MNVDEFTSLLRNPENLEASTQTRQLEEVLEAYPWFQPARALHLKGLHQMNSYKYNPALKATAACTADREVLFDYITSDEFLQDSIAETLLEETPLGDTEIISESVEPNPESDTGMVAQEKDSPLPRSAKEADRILDPGLFQSVDPEIDQKLEAARKKAREALELGRPLNFTRKERYSFSEWLQITSFNQDESNSDPASGESAREEKTVGRKIEGPNPEVADISTDSASVQMPVPPSASETPAEPPAPQTSGKQDRKEKFERIERFIELNPKIVPNKKGDGPEVDIKSSVQLDKKELMTETLARVYLEQGKYKKAIQAYRILSLKYPEKSGFFADQIKAVEHLRQDKSK